MAFENNIPKIKNNFGVDGMRDISARRAATISNMIEEAAKQGIDDSFAGLPSAVTAQTTQRLCARA